MLGKNTSTLPTLKIDLSDHPFIKYDIFEGVVTFTQIDIPIIITTQYFKHHNMSYISHSENNILWNHSFPAINRANVRILSIVRKESTSSLQVLEAISSQKLAGNAIGYTSSLPVEIRASPEPISSKIDASSIKSDI